MEMQNSHALIRIKSALPSNVESRISENRYLYCILNGREHFSFWQPPLKYSKIVVVQVHTHIRVEHETFVMSFLVRFFWLRVRPQWGLKEKETENWIYKQLSTEGLIVLFPWFSACTRPTAGAKALAHNCRAEAREPKPAEASPRFHLWAGHGSSVHISKMFCHIFTSLTKTLQCYSR